MRSLREAACFQCFHIAIVVKDDQITTIRSRGVRRLEQSNESAYAPAPGFDPNPSEARASTAITRRTVGWRDASGTGIRGSAFGRKASTWQCWLESPDYRCIILRDNLSNPSVSRRTTTSRKSESNAPRRCWLRRISRCRKSLLRPAFLTKAIWRVISATYSVLRLGSFGGRSASEPRQHWICVSDLSKLNRGFRVPCAAR